MTDEVLFWVIKGIGFCNNLQISNSDVIFLYGGLQFVGNNESSRV